MRFYDLQFVEQKNTTENIVPLFSLSEKPFLPQNFFVQQRNGVAMAPQVVRALFVDLFSKRIQLQNPVIQK